jgi:hypothetical protein
MGHVTDQSNFNVKLKRETESEVKLPRQSERKGDQIQYNKHKKSTTKSCESEIDCESYWISLLVKRDRERKEEEEEQERYHCS